MLLRLSPFFVFAVMLLAGPGCGSDDSDTEPEGPAQTDMFTAPTGSDAAAARESVIAYFQTNDPDACTEGATKRHIRIDYDGDLARCETVRRNNKLGRDEFTIAGDASVTGDEATVQGQVLITGETFVVELENVDGSWRIDRIRGSQ